MYLSLSIYIYIYTHMYIYIYIIVYIYIYISLLLVSLFILSVVLPFIIIIGVMLTVMMSFSPQRCTLGAAPAAVHWKDLTSNVSLKCNGISFNRNKHACKSITCCSNLCWKYRNLACNPTPRSHKPRSFESKI